MLEWPTGPPQPHYPDLTRLALPRSLPIPQSPGLPNRRRRSPKSLIPISPLAPRRRSVGGGGGELFGDVGEGTRRGGGRRDAALRWHSGVGRSLGTPQPTRRRRTGGCRVGFEGATPTQPPSVGSSLRAGRATVLAYCCVCRVQLCGNSDMCCYGRVEWLWQP